MYAIGMLYMVHIEYCYHSDYYMYIPIFCREIFVPVQN